MIDEKLIEKFYSKLFTIPRKRISITIGFVTIALASILNGTVSKAFFAQRYFFIGLALIISLLITSRLLKMAFNSRRIFFLSLFILIFVEIFDFLAIHLLNNFNLIIMAPAAMAAGLTLILYFTSDSSEFKTFITSASILLAIYPVDFLFSFQAPHRFASYSLTILMGVLMSYLFIRYIDKNYGNVNVKRMLKSFLLFWLTSNPEFFEKELEKISETKRGWTKCLRIQDVTIVSSSFHPGPIRNIGGASLVNSLLERIKNGIYIHSPAKHDSNPSTREGVSKIIDSVNCSGLALKPMKPFRVESDNFEIKIFPFDSLKLILISGKNAIEDIPESIELFAKKIFGECMIADCHNCYKSNYEISADDLIEILSLIEDASKIDTEPVNELKYAFIRGKFETTNTCGNIALLLLDFDGEKHGMVMLDGNNVKCELRNEIEDFFMSRDIMISVLSTDNHSKTAISPKIGYNPVGSDPAEVKKIMDFLRRAAENAEFKPVEMIEYGRTEVTVKVMGNKFFKSVEMAFKELGEKAIYLFMAILFAQLLISLILGDIIF